MLSFGGSEAAMHHAEKQVGTKRATANVERPTANPGSLRPNRSLIAPGCGRIDLHML